MTDLSTAQLLLRATAGLLWTLALVVYLVYVMDAKTPRARHDRGLQNIPMMSLIMHVIIFYVVTSFIDIGDLHPTWSATIRIHGALALILHKWLRLKIARASRKFYDI